MAKSKKNEPEIEFLKYHSKYKPIPKGWIMVDDFSGTHHALYSVLIKKLQKK